MTAKDLAISAKIIGDCDINALAATAIFSVQARNSYLIVSDN